MIGASVTGEMSRGMTMRSRCPCHASNAAPPVAEHAARCDSTIDSPSPRPDACPGAFVQPRELLEHGAGNFDGGMPMPESITWMTTWLLRRRAPTSTLPVSVYLIAFDTRFCTSRRSRLGSDRTRRDVGITTSFQMLLARNRREVGLDASKQIGSEPRRGRAHRPGVEPENVEHGAQNALHRSAEAPNRCYARWRCSPLIAPSARQAPEE